MVEFGVLFVLLIIGLPVGLIIALIVWIVRRQKAFLQQRRYGMTLYGWQLVPPNPWLVEVITNLYRRGRPGEMIAGDYRGRSICALDYSYTTTSSGPNGQSTTTTHRVHAVAVNLPVTLPPLTLSKDSRGKRFLAGSDLELESKAFNDAFRISCADNRYASAVLHPRMMEWMLHNPGLEWQIAGNALVSWGAGYFVIPDVVARLEAMVGVVDLIPPFVLRDYGKPVY